MPLYEYHCPENGITIEVLHRTGQEPANWGELCKLAGTELQNTSAESVVERVLSSTSVHLGKPLARPISRPVGCCKALQDAGPCCSDPDICVPLEK